MAFAGTSSSPDIHAAAGRRREAISEYELAARAVTSDVARKQLLAKAEAVRTRHTRRLVVAPDRIR